MTSNGVKTVPKSTIYLVRHGESTANVAQVNFPPEEDILTENGHIQADLLGKHLSDVVFTRAYASTYQRSRETAKAVLRNSKMSEDAKPELVIDARIRERELGEFVGKPAKEAFLGLAKAVKSGTPILKFELPGAESCKDFDDRVDSFVKDLFATLARSTQPETVLIVSHGITILRLMSKFREPPRANDYSLESWTFQGACTPMKNTAYHIFTVQCPPPPPTQPDGKNNNGNGHVHDGTGNDKICLEFLKYHQRGHLENSEEAKDSVDHAGPIAEAFNKLKQLDSVPFNKKLLL